MLVSYVQQRNSAISIYVSPPSRTSLPPTTSPTALSHHRAPGWAPCALQQLPTSYHFAHGNVCVSMLLSQLIACSFSLTAFTSPFCTSMSLFCPADSTISTIFLDSIYMCVNIFVFFSFWLTSFCLRDSRFTHLSSTDSMRIPLKTRTKTTTWTSNPASGCIPWENKHKVPQFKKAQVPQCSLPHYLS